MPQRIQRKRTKGWRLPENAVSVTRPGRWGNPFVVGEPMPDEYRAYLDWQDTRKYMQYEPITDASEAVRLFRKYWIPYRHGMSLEVFFLSELRVNELEELRGKDLACWCPVGTACHADELLRIANK